MRKQSGIRICKMFLGGYAVAVLLLWASPVAAVDVPFAERVISTAAEGAYCVYAADVDGDGDIDVLSASIGDDKIAWYESDGGLPPTFTERAISTAAGGAWSVYAADVDGDKDTDVLSASAYDDKIAWYESDGGSPPTFSERVISTTADAAVSVYATDVDGDGDTDVLSASFDDDKIAWYENVAPACLGDVNGDGFRNVADFTLFASAYGSQTGDPSYDPNADLNGDGFVNVSDFTQFAINYGAPCP
jgi:hypothetical protein